MYISIFCIFHYIYLFSRETKLKIELEKYRQERPKIQMQFSDLKVGKLNLFSLVTNIDYIAVILW